MGSVYLHAIALAGLLAACFPPLRAQDGDRLAALAANDTYPTFSLTLSAKSPEYHLGSTVWITVVLTNLTNHDIDCSDTYHYEAIDDYGVPIKERHRVPEDYAHGCEVGAGGKVSHMFQLERAFNFDHPGKYRVRAKRKEPFLTDEKGEQKVVYSNWMTITITG